MTTGKVSETAGHKRKRAAPKLKDAKAQTSSKRASVKIAPRTDRQASNPDHADINGPSNSLPVDLSLLDSLELPAVTALANCFRSEHPSTAAPGYTPRQLEQAYPNQHFTQHWQQCQNQELGCQDPQDPLACSWQNFQAPPCGPSLPCSNPECEDGSPCPSITGEYTEPLNRLGKICYDQECVSNGQRADVPCDQHCDTATRCASPCFSDECRVPVCDAACTSDITAVGNPHPLPEHDRREFDVLCHSGTCGIPGFSCIDPQCLAPGYTPASHVHHPIDQYYGYGTNSGLISLDHGFSSRNIAQQIETNYVSQAPTANMSSNMPFCTPAIQRPQQPSSLQPAQGFNPCPSSNEQSVSHSYSYNTNTVHDGPTPGTMTHALTLTPAPISAPSPSQDVYGLAITRPSTTVPQSHTCLWSATNAGNPTQPCGMQFADAADLHAHVERVHIDTLQRSSDPGNTPGYYCRWASCPRNTHCNARPSTSPIDPALTTVPSLHFAARPKLKRHLQTHTHHTPYTCPHCPAVMKTRDAMTKHARTHTGERPYVCEVPGCTKIFATSTELKTHTVVHSGKKPHVCAVCGEGFADSSNLSKHRKTHVSLGMYRCPQEKGGCGCRMKRWDQMRRHWVGRGHCGQLVGDEAAVREYKEAMEVEWRALMKGLEIEGQSSLTEFTREGEALKGRPRS